MDKAAIFKKLDRFCPAWIKRPDELKSIPKMMEYVIGQVLPGKLETKVELIDDDKIIGTVPFSIETANVIGYMHGGTIFTLGDTLAGAYIWSITDENTIAVTTGSSIEYLKPVKKGKVKCMVTLKSREDKKVTLEGIFQDDDEQIVCKMTLNYQLMIIEKTVE